MKNLLYPFCMLVSMLTFQSCEELIDIELPNDQINTPDVYTDMQTANSALINLYTNFRDGSLYSGSSVGLGTCLGLYTDELENLTPSSSSLGYFTLYNNQISPTSSPISNIWSSSYTHIYAINAFIEGLTASNTIQAKDKEVPLAEALLLRALYYQGLAQLFGDIPYVTTTNYVLNSKIDKTNSMEVLKLIGDDLQQIEQKLTYQYRSSDKYYPNKAVVELVLAKNYLLQKQYDKAETYAQKVMSNSLYSMEDNLNTVFKKTAKSTLWQLSNGSNEASTTEAYNFIILTAPNYQISSSLLNTFDTSDQRKKNWISSITLNGVEYFYAYKYKNRTANIDECSVIFRLEEAHFIMIEALIYQQKSSQAISLLNTISNRAGLPDLSNNLNEDELINEMLRESQREFFTEHGRRFFDLKRNNKLSILSLSKPNWLPKHILFPYPEKETILNPNLLPQNNGY